MTAAVFGVVVALEVIVVVAVVVVVVAIVAVVVEEEVSAVVVVVFVVIIVVLVVVILRRQEHAQSRLTCQAQKALLFSKIPQCVQQIPQNFSSLLQNFCSTENNKQVLLPCSCVSFFKFCVITTVPEKSVCPCDLKSARCNLSLLKYCDHYFETFCIANIDLIMLF